MQRVIDLRDIRLIVVHHTEPDHSGSIPKLLEKLGGDRVLVVGHRLAGDLLRHFYGLHRINFRPVEDNETLTIGRYALKFIHTPMLHWPDTIMTYISELGVLLTCDAFGSFSAPDAVFDDEMRDLEKYLEYTRKYVVSIVGKYREYIAKAIDKVVSSGLAVKIIAPGHGVVWRSKPSLIVDYYYRIATGSLIDEKKIVIVYCSSYGLKDNVVYTVKRRLEERGYKVVLLRFSYDDYASLGSVLGEMFDAALIVIVASVYDGGLFPLVDYMLSLVRSKVRLPKKVLGVISYGWSSARKLFESKLREAGLNVIDVVDFRGKGSEDIVNEILSKILNAVQA